MAECVLSAEELLAPMKVDLGIKSDAYDERLEEQIQTAIQEITAEGATLEDTARDRNLVLMYAEWRWRCRVFSACSGAVCSTWPHPSSAPWPAGWAAKSCTSSAAAHESPGLPPPRSRHDSRAQAHARCGFARG